MVEKKEILMPLPCGTITAKDELIWLHEEGPFLPHVFDVIESLVFAKAIVPLPPSPRQSRAALLPQEINLPFRRSDSTIGEKKTKVIEIYNSNLNPVRIRVLSPRVGANKK